MLSSVRNQLAVLFALIAAAAIGFIYLYVVPQLDSRLTAEKLRRLSAEVAEQSRPLDRAAAAARPQPELQRLVRRLAQRAGSRLTLLGARESDGQLRPAFVIADSEVERAAVLPSYPAASAALAAREVTTAVERVAGGRLAEAALAIPGGPKSGWVMVLSESLADVDDNVALIERQIAIAGSIALVAALVAAWFAARWHARRLRRLERAAEQVAEGDFDTAVPVDSSDEVGQLARALNEMRQRLQRLDGARKEFIANASHELRTPIFSLGGFVELLDEDDPDPAAREEFVTTMREQVARLTKLTADLLDLSKLDSGAISLRREPVELGAVVRGVAEEFGPLAERRGTRLRTRAESEAVAAADPGRVDQIVRILIDNAIAHTPEGTEITVTTSLRQGEAAITVRDSGPGIDPAAREQVFERFFTGDDTQGSGLGLAIARELARAMGGDIRLRSRRGRNEFTVILPATDRAAAKA